MFSNEAVKLAQTLMDEVRKNEQAMEILRKVEAFGPDAFPVATVMRFAKKFAGTPKAYDYAAIKTDDPSRAWYLTGGSPSKTWDQLVMFLVTEGEPIAAEDVEIILPEGFEGTFFEGDTDTPADPGDGGASSQDTAA